jgi:hypothetical protein
VIPLGFTRVNSLLGRQCGHGGYQCDYCKHRYCGVMLVGHRRECREKIPRDRPPAHAANTRSEPMNGNGR